MFLEDFTLHGENRDDKLFKYPISLCIIFGKDIRNRYIFLFCVAVLGNSSTAYN